MTGEQIVAQAIRDRTAQGLRLEFIVPDRDAPYVCYAKDEAQKRAWLAKAQAKNWRLTPTP